MIRLGLRLVLASGRGRSVLLAGCTAVVSGLLLVSVALLRLHGYQSQLWSVAADPGTRGGMIFAVVMLGLPPMLLLYQAVRLGTAARERRLAALRLAGATPGEVRLIGAIEVGVAALVGGVLGIGVHRLMRACLGSTGGIRIHDGQAYAARRGLGLVPQILPTWWQQLVVVVVVTLLGIAVGLLAGRGVVVTPLGVVRRTRRRPPRPWGLVLVAAGLLIGACDVRSYGVLPIDSQVPGVLAVGLIVIGTVSLSSWSAGMAGRMVAARASRASLLLAARRLATDPRPAGRAGAAVGGIALVAGGSASFLAQLLEPGYGDGDSKTAVGLVFAVLVVALVMVVGSLAVHSAESFLDHKRPLAALGAMGTPQEVLMRAQRWEAALVTIPTTVAGIALGAALVGAVGATDGDSLPRFLVPLALATLLCWSLLVIAAIVIAVRITRPWLRKAIAATNLRTE